MTNAHLSVPMPGFQGLENDFLDRAGIDQVYDSVGTELVKEAGPHAGKALRSFVTDSFEAGYPNWTANMVERFKKYRGYDPTPYLPVLSGWIVESAEISDRFLHANRKDRPEKVTAIFRQTGRQPELWNPMTGVQRDLPHFKMENGRTSIPLEFDPNGSMFVVFRKPTTATAGEGSNFPSFETVQTLEGP
jgi:hypothetical protein